jgi:hypothetical protein
MILIGKAGEAGLFFSWQGTGVNSRLQVGIHAATDYHPRPTRTRSMEFP